MKSILIFWPDSGYQILLACGEEGKCSCLFHIKMPGDPWSPFPFSTQLPSVPSLVLGILPHHHCHSLGPCSKMLEKGGKRRAGGKGRKDELCSQSVSPLWAYLLGSCIALRKLKT